MGSAVGKILDPVGALLFGRGGSSDAPAAVPAQKGITNAEAQATSNAESATRARKRASLVNQPRSTLLNENVEELLLS